MTYKTQRSKACDIPFSVKKKVWQRDNGHCCYCGNPEAMPSCHYIPRSHGGLGIEENIVTLCARCHYNFDKTDMRPYYKEYLRDYLKGKYENWDETKLVYNKFEWLTIEK